ncbi:fumarate hydratase [Burkholderia gladioli]|uniref:fumarate hydratase n=1 Tax=Burkholderia gladioli TaxID=28095 RepID=UPI00163EE997|nr:fumarate hydratase [Burkholderia gladioli]MBU9194779.1 fumarate hydratase [Burkholderia gladioli]MBU9378915.1 fumarate hydratase [Burkholderia gladioli]
MAIDSATLRRVTAQLYERSLKTIPDDTRAFLADAAERETSPTGRATLRILVESADGARRDDSLVCSDVGIPTYSVKIGTRVRFDGPVRAAIRDGFADLAASISPPILKMVTNPLTHERGHAGKDMPIVSFDVIDDAEHVDIVCSPKAMGTGRWEAIEAFVYPSHAQIERFVLDAMLRAGSQPCLPLVIGVGIGGTFDYAARLAKEQMMRPFGRANPEPMLAAMERRLLDAVNAMGFGPMGTGGDTTVMAVHIDYAASHGFVPVAVCFNCWINRRTAARIHGDGRVEFLEGA